MKTTFWCICKITITILNLKISRKLIQKPTDWKNLNANKHILFTDVFFYPVDQLTCR